MYWRVLARRWMQRAFVCRYGGQDIYRVLVRDPMLEPLTALEQGLFARCIEEHVVAERKPMTELGLPPGGRESEG